MQKRVSPGDPETAFDSPPGPRSHRVMKTRSVPVRSPAITPEIMLRAYAAGIFPMAETADDPGLFWVEPELRGIIPLAGFHLSSRLARTVRSDRFEIRVDSDFEAVIAACGEARPDSRKIIWAWRPWRSSPTGSAAPRGRGTPLAGR